MPAAPLASSSITTPRMGDRSRASRVSPRNSTGRLYAEQHAEAKAVKAMASVDIETVKRAEFQRGFDAAFGPAFDAGVSWLRQELENAGVDVDAVLALGEDEPGDADDEGGE